MNIIIIVIHLYTVSLHGMIMVDVVKSLILWLYIELVRYPCYICSLYMYRLLTYILISVSVTSLISYARPNSLIFSSYNYIYLYPYIQPYRLLPRAWVDDDT